MVNSGGNGGRRDLRPRNTNAVRLRGAEVVVEYEFKGYLFETKINAQLH